MLAIVAFDMFVIVCERTTFNFPKWSRFESLTFKKLVKVMSYNIAEYIVGWLFVAFKMVKNC